MGPYYVYCYLDEQGQPYYFGKGRGYRAWAEHTTVPMPSEDRIHLVLDGVDEETALRCERICIEHFGRRVDGGSLYNKYLGGRGLQQMPGHLNPQFGKKSGNHPACKTYRVITPEGKEEIITGLRAFCREKNLNPQIMSCIANGTYSRSHYKGWQIFHHQNPIYV